MMPEIDRIEAARRPRLTYRAVSRFTPSPRYQPWRYSSEASALARYSSPSSSLHSDDAFEALSEEAESSAMGLLLLLLPRGAGLVVSWRASLRLGGEAMRVDTCEDRRKKRRAT